MIQQQRRRGGALKTVAAFSLGAAVGAGIALLTAPASGAVTRRRIGKGVRKLQRTAGRKLVDARKALVVKAGEAREAASEQLLTARQWMESRIQNGNGHARPRRRAVHA